MNVLGIRYRTKCSFLHEVNLMFSFTESAQWKSAVAVAVAVAVGAVLISSPAAADWQYTNWGDTPEAVMSAAGGAAKPNDDRGKDPLPNQALLTAPYDALGFSFDAFFVFDPADQLVYVDLKPRRPDECNAIRLAVMNTYGEPEERGSFGLLKWWHEESGNVVMYSEIVDCQVRYMEHNEAGQDGGL